MRTTSKRWTGAVAVVFAAIWVGATVSNASQEPNPIAKIVTTKTEAFAVFPAQMVVPGLVRHFEISPDARYLLAVRVNVPRIKTNFLITESELFENDFPDTLFLTVHDRVRNETFEVQKLATRGLVGFDIKWSAEPGVALMLTHHVEGDRPETARYRTEITRVSAADRQSRPIGKVPAEVAAGAVAFVVVPKQPSYIVYGPLTRMNGQRRQVQLMQYDTRGNLQGQMMTDVRVDRAGLRFLADGVTPAVVGVGAMQEEGAGPTTWTFDIRRGSATETEERLALWIPEQSRDLGFSRAKHVVDNGGVKEIIEGLWLEAVDPAEKPRTLLDMQATFGSIASDHSYLAYVANGALFVRPLERMSLAEFRSIEELSVKNRAIQRAKQVGVAANIYAADYDDYFPMAHNFKEALLPYTKNESIFEGFIYVYTGGSLTSIESPTTTVIGYVETPFGRAVVFADSSVRWEPRT